MAEIPGCEFCSAHRRWHARLLVLILHVTEPHGILRQALTLALCGVMVLTGGGCRKKPNASAPSEVPTAAVETPETNVSAIPESTPAEPTPAPTLQPTAPQASPVASQAIQPQVDEAIFIRSIDYIRGLAARNEYKKAQAAIRQLENQNLSSIQRQALSALKAQIPAG
jgi:hypothetical protein